MSAVAWTMIALALAAAASEAALRRRRLQSALLPVLIVWSGTGILGLGCLALQGSGVGVFAVFWAGSFLTWFAARSHLESSILLRMLCILRDRPRSGNDLAAAYEAIYGPQHRLEELFRAGLLARAGPAIGLTAKGRWILWIASWLR